MEGTREERSRHRARSTWSTWSAVINLTSRAGELERRRVFFVFRFSLAPPPVCVEKFTGFVSSSLGPGCGALQRVCVCVCRKVKRYLVDGSRKEASIPAVVRIHTSRR